jgi:hypothetical protein
MGKLYPGSGRYAMCCGRYSTVDPRLVSVEEAVVILEHKKTTWQACKDLHVVGRPSSQTLNLTTGFFGRKKTLDSGVAGSPRPPVVIGVMTVVVLLTYLTHVVRCTGTVLAPTIQSSPAQRSLALLYCKYCTVPVLDVLACTHVTVPPGPSPTSLMIPRSGNIFCPSLLDASLELVR